MNIICCSNLTPRVIRSTLPSPRSAKHKLPVYGRAPRFETENKFPLQSGAPLFLYHLLPAYLPQSLVKEH